MTMKAAQVHKFVTNFSDETEMTASLTISNDVDKPKPGKDELLIRVSACSISPGDTTMLRGNILFMHPNAFPFIPGMDVCGVVEDTNGCPDFQKGDIIVASNGVSPIGGMAEYMCVSTTQAVRKPDSVSVLDAASCSSAITARNAVFDNVKAGDRVLILGGSGGVGSAAIALAKIHGASFVAATSSQVDMCKSIGADVVVNYKVENWWEKPWEQPFDKVIDCVGGTPNNFYDRATKVLKSRKDGGYFIAVTGDEPKPDMTTWFKVVQFMANLPLRPLYTWWYGNSVPGYTTLMPYDFSKGRKEVLDLMNEQKLKIQIDPSSPLPFSEDGVRKAFEIVASGHAHGKVVVQMHNEPVSK